MYSGLFKSINDNNITINPFIKMHLVNVLSFFVSSILWFLDQGLMPSKQE